MKRYLAVLAASGVLFAQAPLVRVEVIGVDGFGNPVAHIDVLAFIGSDGVDRVKTFTHGVGSGLPYGRYRVEVDTPTNFRADDFDLEVGSPQVFATAGLVRIGIENVEITGKFDGRIASILKNVAPGHCRASGVYLRRQYDSRVDEAGGFDFGFVPVGSYSLTCADVNRAFLTEIVEIRADAQPLTIRLSAGDGPASVTNRQAKP
jgi:hypothetical protein